MDIFNAAWMSLGVAVRLGQMVGIQKASSTFDDVEEYSRRGMFWTLFMIDRYKLVIFYSLVFAHLVLDIFQQNSGDRWR